MSKTGLAVYLIHKLKAEGSVFADYPVYSPIPLYSGDLLGGKYADGYDPSFDKFPFSGYCGKKLLPDLIPITDWRDILYYDQPGILFLDDISLIARNRNWTSGSNKILSQLTSNARKRKFKIIYTTQRVNDFDISCRYNVTKIFVPVYDVDKFDESVIRTNPVEWREYSPEHETEWVFPEHSTKERRSTLQLTSQEDVKTVSWKVLQTYYDCNIEPSYLAEQPLSESRRLQWLDEIMGRLLGDSVVKWKYFDKGKYDAHVDDLQAEVSQWATDTCKPLSKSDLDTLVYYIRKQLLENAIPLATRRKVECPKCSWKWDVQLRYANAKTRRCPKCDYNFVNREGQKE